jgi:hypothetical protein
MFSVSHHNVAKMKWEIQVLNVSGRHVLCANLNTETKDGIRNSFAFFLNDKTVEQAQYEFPFLKGADIR